MTGGRRPLVFQEPEDAVYSPAVGGRAGLADDDGRIRERVPGEGRLVTRCLFGDGEERRERGGAPP
jgi:hypothetical protein